jgi:Fic family protein
MIMSDAGWPALGYETLDWQIEPNMPMSNTARRRHGHPYDAAITSDIAHLQPKVEAETLAAAEEASIAIVRFDAEHGSRVVPFSSILLRSESAASSRIEQLTATAQAIALAELGDASRKNATMIVSNTRAMEAAISLADQLDARGIIEMQATLLGDEHPDWVGKWRNSQVWIGGRRYGPHGSMFTPPHHDRVPAAMDDLVSFAGRDDIQALVHAALVHAQFETVHPFPDGNGRTGRAIIHALLRRRGITRNVTVPISAGLLVDVDAYFSSLGAYRLGNIEPIIEQMTDAAFTAIGNATAMLSDLDRVAMEWRCRITARSDSTVWPLTELLMRQPGVNSNVVEKALGVSRPAALNAIGKLEDGGVLVKARGQERNRAWIAVDVVAALDRFADASGRRARPPAG